MLSTTFGLIDAYAAVVPTVLKLLNAVQPCKYVRKLDGIRLMHSKR